MESGCREGGVLKLVHPRGPVEIHFQPISAADVMRRNPRHCVTRPDVFKFPWIVVSPHSLLKPGRVFFIVPYHTIYSLLKSKGIRPDCLSPVQTGFPFDKSVELIDFHHVLVNKALDSVPRHKIDIRYEEWQAQKSCSDKKQYPVEYCPKAFCWYNKYLQHTQQAKTGFSDEEGYGSFCSSSSRIYAVSSPSCNYSPHVHELKSCLKKQHDPSLTRKHDLRVRFAI